MISDRLHGLTKQCVKMVQQELNNTYGDRLNYNVFNFNISNPYYSPESGQLIVNIVNGQDLIKIMNLVNKVTDIRL